MRDSGSSLARRLYQGEDGDEHHPGFRVPPPRGWSQDPGVGLHERHWVWRREDSTQSGGPAVPKSATALLPSLPAGRVSPGLAFRLVVRRCLALLDLIGWGPAAFSP
jgi:hypothetical protein